MKENEEPIHNIIKYPKTNLNDFIGKKIIKNINLTKLYNKNPKINYFNLTSHFIYDQADFYEFYQNLEQKNNIKITKEEHQLLEKIIEDIEFKKSIEKGENFISISQEILNNLNNFNSFKKPETEIEHFIKEKFYNSQNRSELTCQKLASSYLKEKGKTISKSTVHNIIKNKLGYSFLKTTYKNNFLKTNNAIVLSLIFIKIIIRIIKLGFEIIFLDESKIESINSHYKCWRKKNETIFFSDAKKIKLNLLMAIGKDKVYHMTIKENNTNSENYLNFLKELNQKLERESGKKFAIVLDNLKVHKTKEVISFCVEKKINLIFNVPYQSVFNAIELCFRSIKKVTYSTIYDSINDLKRDIENLIYKEKFNNTLIYNFKETLNEYLCYEDNYKYYNFNNFEIS